jgi:hypothetical protein
MVVVPATVPSVAVMVTLSVAVLVLGTITATAVWAGIGPVTGAPETVIGALVGSDEDHVNDWEAVT